MIPTTGYGLAKAVAQEALELARRGLEAGSIQRRTRVVDHPPIQHTIRDTDYHVTLTLRGFVRGPKVSVTAYRYQAVRVLAS